MDGDYTEVQPEPSIVPEPSTPPLPTIVPSEAKDAPADTALTMGQGVLYENGLWYTPQSSSGGWHSVQGSGGSYMDKEGCAIYALWAAAYNTGHTNEQLADAMWDMWGTPGTGNLSLNSNGTMYGELPYKIGCYPDSVCTWTELRDRWGMSINTHFTGTDPGTFSSAVPRDGKYLVYYYHKSGSCHWVYVQDGNVVKTGKAEPNAKTIDDLASLKVKYVYEVE